MNMDNIGILIAVWVTWSLFCVFAGMRIESRIDKAGRRKNWHPGFPQPLEPKISKNKAAYLLREMYISKPKTDAEHKADLERIARGETMTQEERDQMRDDVLKHKF